MGEKLYVYGTLRPGDTEVVKVPGKLYDLGWFPGIKLELDNQKDTVLCEVAEVESFEEVDKYEGFFPEYPDHSLFKRVPYLDGHIYIFNRDVNPVKQVFSGDWLEYTEEKRGINGTRFRKNTANR